MASTDSAAETKPTEKEPVLKEEAAVVVAEGATTDAAVRPPKVAMPDRGAFEAEVDALKRLMAANKAQKAALLKKMEATRSGGSAETVSSNSQQLDVAVYTAAAKHNSHPRNLWPMKTCAEVIPRRS